MKLRRIFFFAAAIGLAVATHFGLLDKKEAGHAAPMIAIFGVDDLLIALGIAAAGSAASGIAGGVASGNAAGAQERASKEATDLQRDMWISGRSDMIPYREAGTKGLSDLVNEMQNGYFNTRPGQFDPSQIANDPGYQFRMAEGQKALERSAASKGMLQSGGTLKSLTRYAQGVASDEYNNAYGRYMNDRNFQQSENNNRYNRMAAMAGVGQTAAQSMGQMGANYANNASNLYGALGNAQAAGAMGAANAFSGGMQSLGNFAQMGAMYGQAGGWGPNSQWWNQVPKQGGG